MSVQPPREWGRNWVVICNNDRQSKPMTRERAERYALYCDENWDCGPHSIVRVTSTGNIIGEPQAPKGKGRT